MKKLTILTDLDDVLWDLCGLWINELNIRNGTSVHPREVTDWDISKFFPSVSTNRLFEPLHDDRIWHRILPIAGSQRCIQLLMDQGHKIRVVTATHPATVSPKVSRFLELFPMFKWEDIVVASDKSLIHGDVMIDDGTHNLEAMKPNIKHLILFDRPHNSKYDADANGMERIRTWNQVYERICTIAEGKE